MKQRKYLTRHEVHRLIAAADRGRHAERNKCIVIMCFIHGFRVSELCQLQVADIDLGEKNIAIHRLKNGFSTIHPITTEEMPYLSLWLKARSTWREANSPWLFLSQKGGEMSRKQVYNVLRYLGIAANIDLVIHPHMLRHACGYALADLGADTRLIQDYLGHRNIGHTVRYTAGNARRFKKIWDKPLQ